MLKSKFCDGKEREERMPGWPMDGVPVKRQVGMIYWYSWGKHTFDIRVMRRALGLPEDHPADEWFMADKPDACGSFHALMSQLQEALGGRSFHDAMAEHDRLMDAEEEADLAATLDRKAKAATAPAAIAPVPFEDAPF